MLRRSRSWLLGLTVAFALGAVLGAATVSRGAFGRGDGNLAVRVAALEALTQNLTRVEGPLNGLPGPHLLVTGVNIHVRNGNGVTEAPNGVGNVVIGYNEEPTFGPPLANGDRGGSHNLVVGSEHRYTDAAGLVAGYHNTISETFATVSGGQLNTASGTGASISGGEQNTASGPRASISGGIDNAATTEACWRVGASNENC